MRLALCLVVALFPWISAANEPLAFPPIGDRYSSPSDEAKAALKALSRLAARTEIPINFVDYEKAIGDVYPDVKLFLDSTEANNMPEVRYLLSNAVDCYLQIQSLWSTSISSDSPSRKYDASTLLLTARPALWKSAAANISGAKAFFESDRADQEKAQKLVVAKGSSLTVANALRAAEEQLAELDRQSRAKESGVPVPEPIPDAEKKDLAALIYADGDFGDDVTADSLKVRLPPIFSKVPPAIQEGRIALLSNGDTCGGVAGLIYASPKTAQVAMDEIASGYGDGRQRIKGLGDMGVGSGKGAVVFRQGAMVVSIQVTPGPKAADAAKKISERIAALFPSDATATPDQGVPTESAVVAGDSLADLLFQDGDYGDSVTGGAFRGDVPIMFTEVSGAADQGTVPLTNLGKQVGGVTGFVFDGDKDAKAAFEKIAGGIKLGTKVPGVGNAAYASRVPSGASQDIVFRRESTVVHIRAPSKNLAALTKVAKKVDGRIRMAAKAAVP